MERIRFEVYSDDAADPRTTTVNLRDVPAPQVWDEVDRVLTARFAGRIERINHAGRTVILTPNF